MMENKECKECKHYKKEEPCEKGLPYEHEGECEEFEKVQVIKKRRGR